MNLDRCNVSGRIWKETLHALLIKITYICNKNELDNFVIIVNILFLNFQFWIISNVYQSTMVYVNCYITYYSFYQLSTHGDFN